MLRSIVSCPVANNVAFRAFRVACLLAAAWVSADGLRASGPSWNAPPDQQTEGVFWRFHWYEPGLTNGNPRFADRFRVNAPETGLDPAFRNRVEARENGLMLIRAEEDLSLLRAAEFYCEAWGGHPGTANKRITVNGRGSYWFPRAGTEEGHCVYFYPCAPLQLTDLVNGYDAVQFAVDKGGTFWGHMLVDNAAIRVALANTHPDLAHAGLAGFSARVIAEPSRSGESFRLRLECSDSAAISSVDFQGWYYGYDENGDMNRRDWHGFTFHRGPAGTIAWVRKEPWAGDWDASMLPAQTGVAVRAAVRFKTDTNLVHLTAATPNLEIRPGNMVLLLAPEDLPAPFWSRDGKPRECSFNVQIPPEQIEEARLHVVAWTGGAGNVREYFKLNGRHYPVAEGSRHEVQYSVLPVDPGSLRLGRNRVEVLSDTEHHGIEILRPGPALALRLSPRH